MSASKIGRRAAPLGIALLALLVFAPSLAVGFRLDDTFQIERNAAVQAFDLGAILAGGYWENVDDPGFGLDSRSDLWRPLTTLSIALTRAVCGTGPLPYHAENLLLHALSSALVVVLVRRWRSSELEAWLAGALFAVAPVHIEPLGSVILRNELWSAVFGLAYLIFDADRKTVRACLCLALALLAKESAVALPLAALFASRVLAGTSAAAALRAALPALLVVLAYLGARWAVLGRLGIAVETAYFGPAVSTLEVWLTMARFAAEHYLPACLIGAPLVFDYSPQSFPTSTASDAGAWIALAAFAALAAGAALAAWRRRSYLGLAVTLFVVLLGPTSNLPTRIGVLGATRLLYMPYLGIACAIACGVAALARRARSEQLRRAVYAAALLGLALLAAQTVRRLAVWIDDVDFYGDICAHAPRNALAQGMLGEAYLARVAIAVQQQPQQSQQPKQQEIGRSDAAPAARAFAASVQIDPRNFLRLGRQLCLSSAIGEAEIELLRGLDAALRARASALMPLPEADALVSGGDAAARQALASWIAEAVALRPTDEQLAALPFTEPRRFLNSSVFVDALALDQASGLSELFALRAADAALASASAAPSLLSDQRAALRALCDATDAAARTLVERTGAIATLRAGDAPALRFYRQNANAVFAQRYARYALAVAQRSAALRARLG